MGIFNAFTYDNFLLEEIKNEEIRSNTLRVNFSPQMEFKIALRILSQVFGIPHEYLPIKLMVLGNMGTLLRIYPGYIAEHIISFVLTYYFSDINSFDDTEIDNNDETE